MKYRFTVFLLILIILFYCLTRKFIENYQDEDIPCFRNYKQDSPCCNIDVKQAQDMGHFDDEHANKMCPKHKPICKNYTPSEKEPWGICTGEEYNNLIQDTYANNYYDSVPDLGCEGNNLIDGQADFYGDSSDSYNSLVRKCKSACNLSNYCGGFNIKDKGFPIPGRKCELKTLDIKNCSKGTEDKSKSWIKKHKYLIYDFIPFNYKNIKYESYECRDPQYPYLGEDGKKCLKTPSTKKVEEKKPFESVSIYKRYTTGKNLYNPIKKMEEFAQFLDNKIVAIAFRPHDSYYYGRDTGNGIQFDRTQIGHKEKYRIIYAGTKNYIYIMSHHRNTKCRYQPSDQKIVCDNKEQNWGLFAIKIKQEWNKYGKRFEIYLKNMQASYYPDKYHLGICGMKRNDSRINCNRRFYNNLEKFIFIIV